MAEPPTQRVRVGDVYLEYARVGRGTPLLVISPSWWPFGPWLVRVAPALADSFELILFNHRGVGGSDAPDDGYSVDQFAADAAGLARTLGFTSVHVLGFAQGGATTLVLARDFPDLVASATVVATGGPTPPVRLEQQRARLLKEIGAEGYEAYIRARITGGAAFSPAFYAAHPDVVQALSDAVWHGTTSEAGYLLHGEARTTYDFGPWIESLRTPVLLAVGSEDHVDRGESTPFAMSQQLAKRLPNAELLVLEGAHHLPMWEATEEFATALRRFVRSAEAGREQRQTRGGS